MSKCRPRKGACARAPSPLAGAGKNAKTIEIARLILPCRTAGSRPEQRSGGCCAGDGGAARPMLPRRRQISRSCAACVSNGCRAPAAPRQAGAAASNERPKLTNRSASSNLAHRPPRRTSREQAGPIMDNITPRRPDALGVHSVDRFVFSVPDLAPAERSIARSASTCAATATASTSTRTAIRIAGAACTRTAQPKRLQYLSFGAYADDFDALAQRLRSARRRRRRIRCRTAQGVWTATPTARRSRSSSAPKVSPSQKRSRAAAGAARPASGAAPSRSARRAGAAAPPVARAAVHARRARARSRSTRDVLGPAPVRSFRRHHRVHARRRTRATITWSRSPSRTGPACIIRAGTSASIDDVGLGAEQMTAQGYTHGWGVGRHVLGSNYFYYVRDPWGSFAEYSYDIDFVPADVEWPAARSSAGGFVLRLGAAGPRRLHRQSRAPRPLNAARRRR